MNQITEMTEQNKAEYYTRFHQGLTTIVDCIFKCALKELDIETGDEPVWSKINGYINNLADECTEVLTWQKNSNCQVTLNKDLGFQYHGFDCELSSCTTLSRLEHLRLPGEGCFTDRYVCWLWGHKDNDGKTKEQSDDSDTWSPKVYLVPDAWSWGAEYDCVPGATVNAQILESIDKLIQDIG